MIYLFMSQVLQVRHQLNHKRTSINCIHNHYEIQHVDDCPGNLPDPNAIEPFGHG